MILMLDNYDSFTYNLVQYFQILGQTVRTVRNDRISLADIAALRPEYIVISPGPGTPSEAGLSLSVIKNFAGKIPILGVCLGHQAIIEAFGGTIIRAPQIIHGKTDTVRHDNRGVFRNIQQDLTVVRYHSLVGDPQSIPDCLEITATAARDGALMGIRHKQYQIEGVQFHPESLGTEQGFQLLENFLRYKTTAPQKTLLLEKSAQKINLSAEEAAALLDELTDGELSDTELGQFLGAFLRKGLTPEELCGFNSVLQKKSGQKSTASDLPALLKSGIQLAQKNRDRAFSPGVFMLLQALADI